jgi:hypothetical protein
VLLYDYNRYNIDTLSRLLFLNFPPQHQYLYKTNLSGISACQAMWVIRQISLA